MKLKKQAMKKKIKKKCLGITLKTKFNYENEKKKRVNNNQKNEDQIWYKNQINQPMRDEI